MGIAMSPSSTNVRLQKVIAAAGLASRRQAEHLIQSGRVTVNGKVVTMLGTCINPSNDHVKVNGRHLKPPAPDVFLILHKPVEYLSTLSDPLKRPTIGNLIEKISVRVFPVGRLDYDSEGLLLLTNNGGIAQACLHPRNHVPKTYLAKVKGVLTNQEIAHLEQGLLLDDGPTAPARVRKIRKVQVNSWIELTIHEGRKHQVKRMLETVGHPVIRLKRVRFGPLHLGDLPPGQFRYLTDQEANALRTLHRRSPKKSSAPSASPSRPRHPDVADPNFSRRSAPAGRLPKQGISSKKPVKSLRSTRVKKSKPARQRQNPARRHRDKNTSMR